MKQILYIFIIFIATFSIQAQDTTFVVDYSKFLLEDELNEKPTYTNLGKAMREYDKVYRLKLKGSGGFYGKIDAVYPAIDTLKNLQYFYVVNEALRDLPSKFAQLHYLQQLYLSGNRFENIPVQIFSLKHLKRLDMRANNLQKVSGRISELKRLEYLYLNDNRGLDDLPIYEIKKLKNLKLINIKNTGIPWEKMQLLEKEMPNTKVEYR